LRRTNVLLNVIAKDALLCRKASAAKPADLNQAGCVRDCPERLNYKEAVRNFKIADCQLAIADWKKDECLDLKEEKGRQANRSSIGHRQSAIRQLTS
jgi:hypothetical protein